MAQYTGKGRIEAAFRRQYADRVPVTFLASSSFGARLAGFGSEEIAMDAAKNAEAILRSYEMSRPDYIIVSSAGTPRSAGDARARREMRRFLADKSTLAQMRPPDPTKRSAAIVHQIEVCEKVISAVQDTPVGAGFLGPWSTAMAYRGDEELLYDTTDDPNFVHELMRFTTALSLRAQKSMSEIGVELWMFEPSASCSLVSPRIYRGFIKPYHEEIVKYFSGQGRRITLHMCGYIDPIMEDVVSTGIQAVSIDGPSSLKKMVEVSQKRVVLIGNVETRLFVDGTKEQIEQAVRDCIETAAQGSAYILASGCEIPQNALIENVRYLLDCAHQYGRYH